MFTAAPPSELHPALRAHIASHFVVHASHSAESGCYTYCEARNPHHRIHVGGVVGKARARHYPTYHRANTRRKTRTNAKGSSAKQGVAVHRQLAESLHKPPTHRLALAVLEYWAKRGETLQVAEVPCWVPQLSCMTQADCITRNARGELCLYEIKTGFPVGGFVAQGELEGVRGEHVPSTKMNHWQLQLRYTQLGLLAANIPVKRAVVLQVHDYKPRGAAQSIVKVKVRPQPKWVKKIK